MKYIIFYNSKKDYAIYKVDNICKFILGNPDTLAQGFPTDISLHFLKNIITHKDGDKYLTQLEYDNFLLTQL